MDGIVHGVTKSQTRLTDFLFHYIKASASGKVIMAKYYGGYGNCIIIDHGGGMSTLYAHMSAYVAKEGDWVSQGQVIGKVGSTGNSTGPHLHFEVRVNGQTVDPQGYVK